MSTPGGPPSMPSSQPTASTAPVAGAPPVHPGAWVPGPTGPVWPPGPQPLQVRDTTARTLGAIAIVVAGLAMLVPVVMMVVPFLFLLPFMGEGEDFMGTGPGIEEPMSTGLFAGSVVVGPDGRVSGQALADAVGRPSRTGWGPSLPADLRCDGVENVHRGAGALCTSAPDRDWYAVVRFTDSEGSFTVHTMSDFEEVW